MKENFQRSLYLALLICFVIVLLFTILSYNYIKSPDDAPFYLMFFVEYHALFMLLLAIFGIVFGSVTQVMTSKKIESNKEQLDLLQKFFKKALPSDQKEIIDYLVKNKGVCTQYELTKFSGLNKLKVSRTLVEMNKKNMIHKEKIGKINKVFLNQDLAGAIDEN